MNSKYFQKEIVDMISKQTKEELLISFFGKFYNEKVDVNELISFLEDIKSPTSSKKHVDLKTPIATLVEWLGRIHLKDYFVLTPKFAFSSMQGLEALMYKDNKIYIYEAKSTNLSTSIIRSADEKVKEAERDIIGAGSKTKSSHYNSAGLLITSKNLDGVPLDDIVVDNLLDQINEMRSNKYENVLISISYNGKDIDATYTDLFKRQENITFKFSKKEFYDLIDLLLGKIRGKNG